jgi:hypothetical protein
METLGGFPNLPALWLRRAKPVSANAISVSAEVAGVAAWAFGSDAVLFCLAGY